MTFSIMTFSTTISKSQHSPYWEIVVMLKAIEAKCPKIGLQKECHYDECLYSKCLYAECRGAKKGL
jgi:hypothetical protein